MRGARWRALGTLQQHLKSRPSGVGRAAVPGRCGATLDVLLGRKVHDEKKNFGLAVLALLALVPRLSQAASQGKCSPCWPVELGVPWLLREAQGASMALCARPAHAIPVSGCKDNPCGPEHFERLGRGRSAGGGHKVYVIMHASA